MMAAQEVCQSTQIDGVGIQALVHLDDPQKFFLAKCQVVQSLRSTWDARHSWKRENFVLRSPHPFAGSFTAEKGGQGGKSDRGHQITASFALKYHTIRMCKQHDTLNCLYCSTLLPSPVNIDIPVRYCPQPRPRARQTSYPIC